MLSSYLNDNCCSVPNVEAIDLSEYEKLIKQIAEDLSSGKIKKEELSVDMINKTYSDLSAGAKKGWGNDFIKFGKDAGKDITAIKLHQNLFRFSGAKTTVQTYEINNLLYNKDGQIKSKNEFITAVLKLNQRYNRHYLETEYNTTVKAGNMIRQWEEFKQDIKLFPNLKYVSVQDDRVREEHQKLNGVIKPINDSFWDDYFPPNDWNCRCYVKQTAEEATKQNIKDDSIKNEFRANVAKDEIVFSNDQTYFKITKELGEKEFNIHFEKAKIDAPYIKIKDVDVSLFADLEDYKENLDTANLIKEKFPKIDIKLRPHINGDILTNISNPEYLINGKLAERKAPKGTNLRNSLVKAQKQGCEIVIIDLIDSLASLEEIKKELKSKFRFDTNFPLIQDIIIITKDKKVIEINRNDLNKKANGYK